MFTTLDIDIKQIAAPLVGEPEVKEFATPKTSSISKKRLGIQLNNKLDVFILAIEGAGQHVKELDKEKSKILLKDTNRIIDDFYALDDSLSKKNHFHNQELKSKIQYLFKVLYKFETILHKKIYKDIPVKKTPHDILENISKINRNTLSKIASKNAL